MPQNPFDQASRYVAKLDPPALLAWLFDGADAAEFRGWLDARTLPFPGDPERVCDTVAWLRERGAAVDWAVPIEFNLEPDAAMFGRLLVYLGHLWLEQRRAENQRERYAVGAVVVNLTGRGQAGRDLQLGAMQTRLQVIERNLAHEDAATLLDGIAAGRWSRALLPWAPLMRGGSDSAILDRWQALANAEPDASRRADYAGLAVVLAEAAGRRAVWKEALKEWNMVQSQQVLEWMAEGELGAKRQMLLRLLNKRSPPGAPAEVTNAIQASKDPEQISRWFDAAVDAASLAEFRKAMSQ